MSSDRVTYQKLHAYCDCTAVFAGDVCTELSLHRDASIFGGTIRHYSPTDKKSILALIGRLERLQKLNLRKNNLGTVDLPLTQLVDLNLGSNQLETVPEWLRRCPLQHLHLGANDLTDLPEWISAFPLQTLKIHKNFIAKVPHLPPTLQVLNLYLNEIKTLPPLEHLKELTYLCFGALPLTDFEFDFPKLEWLTITLTNLAELSPTILHSPVKGARLVKNKISKLPAEIGKMQTLTNLFLYDNLLSEVPGSFYELPLRKLNLARNPLRERESLRKAFGKLEFFEI